MKIGICITTTPDREDVFKYAMYKWLNQPKNVLPTEANIYIHNDVDRKGVGYSKNRCLANTEDCDFVFCFDNDIWPITRNWQDYYINSGLQHATYTFDRKYICAGKNYIEFEDPNGCMMFFTRKCIDTAGGWDTEFKGYGYEHSELSTRIFNMGLTPARFIDVKKPGIMFDMADCQSSFTDIDREMIPANFKLYQEKFYSKEFIPYK